MTRTPPPPRPSGIGLRSVKLLEGIPNDALDAVAAQCRWRRYVHDQRIISRDADDHDVYLVSSGRVRVTAFSAAGREVMFVELRTGECFGELAAIDGAPRSADVVAIEDTLVAAMTPALFKSLLRQYPEMCDRLLRRLVSRVRDLSERIYEYSTLGVPNRVHAELLRLARQAGVKNNVARIDPAPKHTDMAAQISTYREQVARELSAMAKQGLVRKDGRALVIPDVALLEKMVTEVRRSS